MTKDYRCEVFKTFKKDCKHYAFFSDDCFPWDLSLCPMPHTTHKWSHCEEYICEFIGVYHCLSILNRAHNLLCVYLI